MKKKTKKILISLAVLLTILLFIAYLRLPDKEIVSSTVNNYSIEEIKRDSIYSTTGKTTPSPQFNSEINKIPEATIKASIIVSGKSFDASIPENKNIYDLMIILMNDSKNNNFTFHAKEYKGMGNFVDMINGVYGTPGKYWIYYINDNKATVGISQYIVKNGDIIKWEQEGI